MQCTIGRKSATISVTRFFRTLDGPRRHRVVVLLPRQFDEAMTFSVVWQVLALNRQLLSTLYHDPETKEADAPYTFLHERVPTTAFVSGRRRCTEIRRASACFGSSSSTRTRIIVTSTLHNSISQGVHDSARNVVVALVVGGSAWVVSRNGRVPLSQTCYYCLS